MSDPPRPHAPLVSDSANPKAWRRFLDYGVKAALQSFLDVLRGDALNRAQAVEAEVGRWQGALAVALVEGKHRNLDPAGVLRLLEKTQMIPVEALVKVEGIPASVIEEGAVLMTRREEFRRRAAEVGLEDTVVAYEAAAAQARALGIAGLAEVSAEESHFRALVKEHSVPFRAQAFFSGEEKPSRILLSFCLLRGFRMPETTVSFIPRKGRGKGRSGTRPAGLAGSFLRVLPPPGARPGRSLEHHAGPLRDDRRSRAFAAAAEAIGLDYIPARGEILLRLLAAAGEEGCVSALKADAFWEPPSMEDPGAYEHLARPRHGPVLKARIKALERECQRALEQGEAGMRDSMGVTPLELSMLRCGVLLWKFGRSPAKVRPGETTGWRLARPGEVDVDDVPPPPLPGGKRPRGGTRGRR